MSTWRDRVTQSLGDAASRSGVLSETAGKIFAVLYLNPGPLSLDEISREVGTSKGNASVQVRELLDLGMVRKVWVRRSRRDYYEAVTDLWSIAAEVIGRRDGERAAGRGWGPRAGKANVDAAVPRVGRRRDRRVSAGGGDEPGRITEAGQLAFFGDKVLYF